MSYIAVSYQVNISQRSHLLHTHAHHPHPPTHLTHTPHTHPHTHTPGDRGAARQGGRDGGRAPHCTRGERESEL